MSIDLALTQEQDGSMMLHKADCKAVRYMAEQGHPVMTMLDCQVDPATLLLDIKRHSCLQPSGPADPEAA